MPAGQSEQTAQQDAQDGSLNDRCKQHDSQELHRTRNSLRRQETIQVHLVGTKQETRCSEDRCRRDQCQGEHGEAVLPQRNPWLQEEADEFVQCGLPTELNRARRQTAPAALSIMDHGVARPGTAAIVRRPERPVRSHWRRSSGDVCGCGHRLDGVVRQRPRHCSDETWPRRSQR